MIYLLLAGLLFLSPVSASYREDLEELGYCVFPNVLSTSEAEALYERVWNEFIEKGWPKCKMIASYTQPEIILTPRGVSVLGITN